MDKTKWLALILSILMIALIACSNSKYQDYNAPQQNAPVGGGCGVSPQDNYEKLTLRDVINGINQDKRNSL